MKTNICLDHPWSFSQRLLTAVMALLLGGSLAWAKKPPKPPPEPESGYRMVDLGTLGGGQSEAWKINDAGWVVGHSHDLDGNRHGFVVIPWDTDDDGRPDLWFSDNDGDTLNDLMIDLGVLSVGPTTESFAHGINDLGQVVGLSSADQTGYPWHACLWREVQSQPEPGQPLDLGTMDGGTSIAWAINNLGQVVGEAENRAFLINPLDTTGDGSPDTWFNDGNGDGYNDLMIDLGSTLGGSAPFGVIAHDINDVGEVVGNSDGCGFLIRPLDTDGDREPDCWFQGENGINNLMILLPPWGRATDSSATAINATGLIAGSSAGEVVLWLMDSSGALLESNLGQIRGYSGTGAWDLNDAGETVGFAASTLRVGPPPKYKWAAFVSENGSLIKLADRVVDWGPFDNELSRAFGINQFGELVGQASTVSGHWNAFIAVPVPQT